MKCVVQIVFLWLVCTSLNAQVSFQKDSLQIKVYTNLEIRPDLSLDTITVQKIFCDYCSKKQLKRLEKKSKYLTYKMFQESNNKDEGSHLVALTIRMSRKEFDTLNIQN